MTHRVELTASASADLRELIEFIAEDSPPAAERLLGALEARVLALSELPERGSHPRELPERGSHPRELLELGIRDYRQVIESPARIIYRLHDHRVVIYLIADSRRDLQRLLSRRLLGG